MGFELVNNLINQRFTFIFKWWLVIQSQKVLYHYPLTYWDQGSFKQDLCNIDKNPISASLLYTFLMFELSPILVFLNSFYASCSSWIHFYLLTNLNLTFNAVKDVSLHSSASPTLLVTDQTMRLNTYKNHHHQKHFYCRVWNGPLMKLFCCRIHTWSNLQKYSCFTSIWSSHCVLVTSRVPTLEIRNKF